MNDCAKDRPLSMDSFIFDEDLEELGTDIECYCPKCRTETPHSVVAKYEDDTRKVQCSPCGEVHLLRKNAMEAEEEAPPEPPTPRRKQKAKKLTFEEFFKKHANVRAPAYSFRNTYEENAVLTHPTFGLGFVSDHVGYDKIVVSFQDGQRILVHGKKVLPGAPPELAAPTKKSKLAPRAGDLVAAQNGAALAAEAAAAGKTGKAAKAAKPDSREQAKGKAAKQAKGHDQGPAAKGAKPAAARPSGKVAERTKPAAKAKPTVKSMAGTKAAKKSTKPASTAAGKGKQHKAAAKKATKPAAKVKRPSAKPSGKKPGRR